jgi:hypothetical protein
MKAIFIIPCRKITYDFENYLANTYGGYTVVNCTGAWLNEKDNIVYDNIFKFEVVTDQIDALRENLIKRNKEEWKESCIYFEVIDSKVEFLK